MSQQTTNSTSSSSGSLPSESNRTDERPTASELLVDCVKEYAKERPEGVAIWAFGIGFIVGWKLKPW